ncbi:hypothetical protein, partial [Butyricicoccus sp.]|uniref:hypothetical protein n=1 Tax=Butyricicoccus sp. TaxID=2049021 RepID=UPI003F15A3AA
MAKETSGALPRTADTPDKTSPPVCPQRFHADDASSCLSLGKEKQAKETSGALPRTADTPDKT